MRNGWKRWQRLIRLNLRQLTFIFASFFLMAVISYLHIGYLLRARNAESVNDALAVLEADTRTILLAAEANLKNISYIVSGMLKEGASNGAILKYLSSATEYLHSGDMDAYGLTGVYGYLRGEFLDGLAARRKTPPPPDFKPQTRPWFDAAVRGASSEVIYTEPYIDASSDKFIITAVRKLAGDDPERYGILALDLDLDFFSPRKNSIMRDRGVYNFILDKYLTIVWHPKEELIGKQLLEISEDSKLAHNMILSGREVEDLKFANAYGVFSSISIVKMYNGWHIGQVTPFWQYYKNLYYMLILSALLSLIFSFSLSYILLRLYDAKTRSEEENRSKSSFLARMSHEIRTPMNAIIGLSEMVLRENPPENVAGHVSVINQAGNNLLAIINDILDFSKIESGNFQVVDDNYEISSLLSDTIAIIHMRLKDKPVSLETDIDLNIPRVLHGDAARLQQILLNLLSNAVKYTRQGFIKFSTAAEAAGEGRVKLIFSVRDSGIGIKGEDLPKLFTDFARFDLQRNTNIEGSGLGLSIARNLCQAMGGDINAESEYGQGSVFTASVLQKVADWRPMEILAPPAPVSGPYQADFTAPGFKVLVVDDNEMNLAVAKGLLAPYLMDVDFCLSGEEALALVKRKRYDLVFLDHMMPGMDGLETAAAVRALGEDFKGLPLVAFTANAVAGMEAMFLSGGFTDFLSKPIEMDKLSRLMERLIPAGRRAATESREPPAPGAAPLEIEGVDAARGLLLIGGDAALYREALRLYGKDAAARLPYLSVERAENDLKAFVTHVHSLKSASASIGAGAISLRAGALEEAANNRDLAPIRRDLEGFRQDLAALLAHIAAALSAGREPGAKTELPAARLAELRAALAAEDVGAADAILAELNALDLDNATRAVLTDVADLALASEFAKAAQEVEALLP